MEEVVLSKHSKHSIHVRIKGILLTHPGIAEEMGSWRGWRCCCWRVDGGICRWRITMMTAGLSFCLRLAGTMHTAFTLWCLLRLLRPVCLQSSCRSYFRPLLVRDVVLCVCKSRAKPESGGMREKRVDPSDTCRCPYQGRPVFVAAHHPTYEIRAV